MKLRHIGVSEEKNKITKKYNNDSNKDDILRPHLFTDETIS